MNVCEINRSKCCHQEAQACDRSEQAGYFCCPWITRHFAKLLPNQQLEIIPGEIPGTVIILANKNVYASVTRGIINYQPFEEG